MSKTERYNSFEKEMARAMRYVNSAYPSWMVDSMSDSELQYAYGKLLAVGHVVKDKPVPDSMCGFYFNDTPLEIIIKLTESKCHVVYFMYGANDNLLYIGRTDNFNTRWRAHVSEGKKDLDSVNKIVLHVFETKAETMFYETQKIAVHKPVWNTAGIGLTPSHNKIEPNMLVVLTRIKPKRKKEKHTSSHEEAFWEMFEQHIDYIPQYLPVDE